MKNSKLFLTAIALSTMFTLSNLKAQWIEIEASSSVHANLEDIWFVNDNTGYLAGGTTGFDGYRFLKTTNAGTDWFPQAIDTTVNISYFFAVRFINANTGFVAGSSNRIYKTTNGGSSWTGYLAPIIANQVYDDLFFINDNTGYAAGRYGMVAKTTDGGITWNQITQLIGWVREIQFLNENTGFAITSAPSLYKTTDAGTSWESLNIAGFILTNFPGMYFFDENTGYISGKNILRTTNGGQDWTVVLDTATGRSLHEIVFVNENTGFALGDNEGLKTTDGGNNWISMNMNNTTNQIYWGTFFMNENTGFAAGIQGKVYKTETGGVNIQSISSEVPSGFRLHQNFPNPFNPNTTIAFDIQSLSNVKLVVYDALGKEVATLVNQNLSPGSYNYQFSTDDYQMTSGVYFYKLETAEFKEIRRMVLVK